MSQERQPSRSRWERTSAFIGVAAAAVGLIVTLFGLPNAFASALGRSTETKAAEIALEQARAQLAARGPRLDVSYVFLVKNLNEGWPYGPVENETDRPTSEEATTVLSFPVVANEVLSEGIDEVPRACKLDPRSSVSVVSLVVRNRGSNDADRIEVQADRLALDGPVQIHEAAAGGDDYAAKLRASAKRPDRVTIRIPRTLGPGEGVLVPLWESAAAWNRYDRWCVISGVALQPRVVRFRDALLGSRKTIDVRRLNDPVVLANGLVGRG